MTNKNEKKPCKLVSYLDMNACCRPVVLSLILDTSSRHFEVVAQCSSVIALVCQFHRIWYKLTKRPNQTSLRQLLG